MYDKEKEIKTRKVKVDRSVCEREREDPDSGRQRQYDRERMFPCGFLTPLCDKLHRDSMFKHY